MDRPKTKAEVKLIGGPRDGESVKLKGTPCIVIPYVACGKRRRAHYWRDAGRLTATWVPRL